MAERTSQERRSMTGRLSAPHVSVIIPVYNGGERFRRCLASLAQASPPPSAVVVVADGDTDGSRRVAQEFGARVLTRSSPGGPALARNMGAHAVRKDDILFFVDGDVAVRRDTIGHVASAFGADPSLAAVIGSYDDAPAEINFHSQFKNLLHHYVHQTAREEASTFWGACGAIRHEVFQEIGGFDERYRYPSIEDIELGYRLRRDGHRIRLVKTLQVKHLKCWRMGSMVKADVFYRALPWTELICRDRGLPNDLNLDYSSRLSALLAYGFFGSVLAAFWSPTWLAVSGGLGVALLLLNAQLYQFFRRKRGLGFALHAIPWHWFYLFYSGVAFAAGTARYLLFTRSTVPGDASGSKPLPSTIPASKEKA